jgi:hypothetical protein
VNGFSISEFHSQGNRKSAIEAPSPAANFRALEAELNPENFFHATRDQAGGDIEFLRHFDPVDIHDGMKSAL